MATHILIHWVFPTPRGKIGKSLPEQTGTLEFNNRNLHRRDRSEQERWARDYTITHIFHHATICFWHCSVCLCSCTREKSRKTLSQKRSRGHEGLLVLRRACRQIGPLRLLIALLGAIISDSYHSGLQRRSSGGTSMKVLSFCVHSRQRFGSCCGNGWRERGNVEERKTPKHKQQN